MFHLSLFFSVYMLTLLIWHEIDIVIVMNWPDPLTDRQCVRGVLWFVFFPIMKIIYASLIDAIEGNPRKWIQHVFNRVPHVRHGKDEEAL